MLRKNRISDMPCTCKVDSVGGCDELFRAGSAGECDAGEGDADCEFADAGTEHTGGAAVSSTAGARAR